MDSLEMRDYYLKKRGSQFLEYPKGFLAMMAAQHEYDMAVITRSIELYLSGEISRQRLEAINAEMGIPREAKTLMKLIGIL
ncbi:MULTISPECIES: hypothetical protein [Aerococcus]|uniref:hypothetical protein n=1 Tax=Aerococcus TaxID=1375 RepID=UPI000DCBF5AC|nr:MULTISPECIES: hypothetical protein [Aerococcus]KAA9299816.1 hypothetical protein F6I08_00140 [Aerococcus tenax]MDK8133228.1 hypothetical protein [Aerococcus urinae]MDK8485363.1 hypothetical protein [Aerococcus urinae]MDL5178300.1 hypothetical protein [Aerococcus tenax]MDL5207315.1 hypothetical protein [Aerococcus tenax]